MLQSGFGTLWLQAEMSNFSRPASGHFYFTLKDSQSQIRCAMFRGRNQYVKFKPQNGDAVLVRGKLGLYAARGDFQLIVEHMEPAGAGQLQLAFEATKRKLDELGWFAQESKLPLPAIPHTIGVITSPTGAAIRDVLQVLARRYPQAHVIIYPTLVQGADAAPGIVNAIATAERRAEADVLLLVRGGGSLEDLWAFNEESVAAAIKACTVPVVAGVGHEVDVTISDLVADLRAPTPSAAAELATPDGSAMIARARQVEAALSRVFSANLQRAETALAHLHERLQARHPRRRLEDRSQRIDDLELRLRLAWQSSMQRHQAQNQRLLQQLHAHSPADRLQHRQATLSTLEIRLKTLIDARLSHHRGAWQSVSRALDTVSPLATLGRGFAVVQYQGQVLSDANSVKTGDNIHTRLAKGELISTIHTINLAQNLPKRTL